MSILKNVQQNGNILGINRNIVTNKIGGSCTAYGGAMVIDLDEYEDLMYEWIFNISKIGYVGAIALDRCIFAQWFFKHRKCYGIDTNGTRYNAENDQFCHPDYEYMKKEFKTGDKIILRLNLKAKEMLFIKNGKDYGSMEKIVQSNLKSRVDIYLNKAQDGIELIQFKIYSVQMK